MEVRTMRYVKIAVLLAAVAFGTQACILVPVPGPAWHHHHHDW